MGRLAGFTAILGQMNPTSCLLLCIIIGLGIPSGVILADDDHQKARRLLESGEVLPLTVILEKVQVHHQGKILEVELEQKSGKIIYEIEMLNENGIVYELYVDAKTGEVLRTKVDDEDR